MAMGWVKDRGIFPALSPLTPSPPIPTSLPIAREKFSPIPLLSEDLIPNRAQWGFLSVVFFGNTYITIRVLDELH